MTSLSLFMRWLVGARSRSRFVGMPADAKRDKALELFQNTRLQRVDKVPSYGSAVAPFDGAFVSSSPLSTRSLVWETRSFLIHCGLNCCCCLGTLRLTFDNSHSTFRSKTIAYKRNLSLSPSI